MQNVSSGGLSTGNWIEGVGLVLGTMRGRFGRHVKGREMNGCRRRTLAPALGLVLALVLVLVLGCVGMPGPFGRQPATPRTSEGRVDVEPLLSNRCTWCHSQDRIRTKRFDRAGWERTIDRMREKGARLTEEERRALIDHLSRRDETQP